ncbi:MAG: hypothetical protein ABIO85_07280 [Sphingomicrobium sp.]
MARDSLNRIQSAPMRRRPMNPLVPLAVVLVLLVGALFFLSSSAKQQPTHLIETDVASAPAR